MSESRSRGSSSSWCFKIRRVKVSVYRLVRMMQDQRFQVNELNSKFDQGFEIQRAKQQVESRVPGMTS